MSEVIKDKIKKLIQKKNELAAEKRIQERKIENAGYFKKTLLITRAPLQTLLLFVAVTRR